MYLGYIYIYVYIYIRNTEGRVAGWGTRPPTHPAFYIPYIFHIYFLNIFHICSLVCFLIYGVNRRQVLIAKPRLYLFTEFTPFIVDDQFYDTYYKYDLFKEKHAFIRRFGGA